MNHNVAQNIEVYTVLSAYWACLQLPKDYGSILDLIYTRGEKIMIFFFCIFYQCLQFKLYGHRTTKDIRKTPCLKFFHIVW